MSGVWKRAWRAAVVAGATLAVCVPASLSLADDATDAKTKELKQMQRAAAAQEAELKAALEGVQADMVNLAVQLQRTNAAIPKPERNWPRPKTNWPKPRMNTRPCKTVWTWRAPSSRTCRKRSRPDNS